jgi:hypothetical protein
MNEAGGGVMVLKSTLIALSALCVLMPDAAMAKKYRPNDRSTNNTCKFVHDWYLYVKVKHTAFATTGGLPYTTQKRIICQASGGDTVAVARTLAKRGCESGGKKRGIRGRCKVVESR